MAHSDMLVVKNKLQELERIAAWFERHFRSGRLSLEAHRHFQLSCDEWVTNLISYAYEDGADHRIYITLTCEQERWILQIEDDGVAYNPLERGKVKQERTIEGSPIGGLGIHFIREMMDELTYEQIEGRNRLTMIKLRKE